MPNIKRCESFGVGYDGENEMCRGCESANKCLREQTEAQEKMRLGIESKSPIVELIEKNKSATSPRMVPVEVTRPMVEGGKVIMTIKFDITWMRKVLGWLPSDDDKDDGGKPKA